MPDLRRMGRENTQISASLALIAASILGINAAQAAAPAARPSGSTVQFGTVETDAPFTTAVPFVPLITTPTAPTASTVPASPSDQGIPAASTPAAAKATPPAASPSTWHAGVIAGSLIAFIATAACIILALSARRQSARRTLLHNALADGSTAPPSALELTDSSLPEFSHWNSVVARLARAEAAATDKRITDAAGDRTNRRSDSTDSFNDLWLGILLIDADLNVIFANPAARNLLTNPANTASIQFVPLSTVIESDELTTVASDIVTHRRPRAVCDHETTSEGTKTILRLTVRPMRQSDRAAAMILVEDITQQRAAEEVRTTLVAQVAHELRTPLTTIRLYVEEAIEEEDDAAIRARALQVINQESRRLDRVVGDMLSVSEIEAGGLSIRPAEITLKQIISDLELDFGSQAESKQIEFSVNPPPKYPRAFADRERLVLALHNVIGNAIKYTPAGGKVTVTVDADETHLTVNVTDTGPGIPEDEHERIFERFYRATSAREGSVQGTGLGLPLAREVIRRHGGDVTLSSVPDEGSTFTIRVPITRDLIPAAPASPSEPELTESPGRDAA